MSPMSDWLTVKMKLFDSSTASVTTDHSTRCNILEELNVRLILISATNVIGVTSGFRRGVNEICALQEFDAPCSGTDGLSRNVGINLPFYAASDPQKIADLISYLRKISFEFSNCVMECTKFITNFEKCWSQ